MQKTLARRIGLFARTIAVIWLLALVAWLQKLDSADLSGDVHDLTLIAAIKEVDRAERLKPLPGRTFENTISWLGRAHPDLSKARVDVRQRVVDLLLDRGANLSLVEQFSGKSSAPSTGAIRFHVLRVADAETPPAESGDADESGWSLSSILDSRKPPAGDHLPEARDENSGLLVTVAQVLDELQQLARPRTLAVAVDVAGSNLSATQFRMPGEPSIEHPSPDVASPGGDEEWNDRREEPGPAEVAAPRASPEAEASIPHPPSFIAEEDIPGTEMLRLPSPERESAADGAAPPGPTEHGGRIDGAWVETGRVRARRQQHWLFVESASLVDEAVRIDYFWADNEFGTVLRQDQDLERRSDASVFVPVRTETVVGPSLLELSDPGRGANGPLLRLAGSPQRMAYLRRAYGHLPLEDATDLASEGLAEAYRSVSLFGFQISTRRFPLAVLACMSVALWQTLAALLAARSERGDVLGHLADESSAEMLVSHRLVRFLLWIVLPLWAMWASLPLVPLSTGEMQWVLLGASVLACLGAGCVWVSRNGMQPVPAAEQPDQDTPPPAPEDTSRPRATPLPEHQTRSPFSVGFRRERR